MRNENTVRMYIAVYITYNNPWEHVTFWISHILHGCSPLLCKWTQSLHILMIIHCRGLRKTNLFKIALLQLSETEAVLVLHPLTADNCFLTSWYVVKEFP